MQTGNSICYCHLPWPAKSRKFWLEVLLSFASQECKKIHEQQEMSHNIKDCVCYIFASLFFKSNRKQLWNKQMFHISLLKLFLFLRKLNFRILDIQISWHHQLPKHKTRITFYYITCLVLHAWTFDDNITFEYLKS